MKGHVTMQAPIVWEYVGSGLVMISTGVAIIYFNYRTLRDAKALSAFLISIGGAIILLFGFVLLVSGFNPAFRNEFETLARMLP